MAFQASFLSWIEYFLQNRTQQTTVGTSLCIITTLTIAAVFAGSYLTFHSHIDKIVARALNRSNLILKCFDDATFYLDESIHGLCSPHIGISD